MMNISVVPLLLTKYTRRYGCVFMEQQNEYDANDGDDSSSSSSAAIGTECEAFSQYPVGRGIGGRETYIMVKSTETTITFVMRHTAQAWLSIGFSKSGYMVGPRNIAILGSPDNGVAKYLLQGTSPNDVVYMDGTEQTLVNTTFTQNAAEGSELTFTRFLEDGENPDDHIMSNGRVKLIWAFGGTNDFLGHLEAGSIDITIGPCQIFDASGALIVSVDTAAEKRVLKAHGILATIAIGFLMPIGVLSSAARKWLGICWKKEEIFDQKTWFFLHVALMGTSSILFLALFILAVVGKGMGSGETVHFQTVHEITGLVLFLLVLIQSTIATLFRPSPTTTTSAKHLEADDDDNDNNNVGTAIGDEQYPGSDGVNSFDSNSVSKGTDDDDASTMLGTKSVARKFWEAKHTIGGFVIIAIGCYELKSGLDLYTVHYGETTNSLGGLLYGWIAVVGVLLLTAAFQIYSRKRKVSRHDE